MIDECVRVAVPDRYPRIVEVQHRISVHRIEVGLVFRGSVPVTSAIDALDRIVPKRVQKLEMKDERPIPGETSDIGMQVVVTGGETRAP